MMASLLVAKEQLMALVIIVCSNCVMIFKIIYFFQFSNNNSEKYLTRSYHNNIKGKMHKFEKIWCSFHKV